MIRKFILSIAPVLLSASMQASFAPQVSEYFITQEADFDVDVDRQVVEYEFTLRARKPLPEGSLIQIRFQNPASKNDFFVREHVVTHHEREIFFTSGNVDGLKLNKDYRIEATLFDSPSKGQILCEHSQRLFFEMKKKKYKDQVKDWYEGRGGSRRSNASTGSSTSSSSGPKSDPRFQHRHR
ncbi:MAG: hypothetical protein AAGB46_09030 [Verrucomicrobiota bacterium]